MTCSPARLAANRANAAKSTGPKTEEGKARSRANAMQHGLAAEVVRTVEEERAAEAAGAGSLSGWLEGEVAVLAMRIERAHRAEERERERAAIRAGSCWDEDRGREADRIARGMGKRPDAAVRRLAGTVQGCDWLIERWGWLRDAAGREGGWTEEQQALAFDLQGIPEGFRGAGTGADGQASLARSKIEALEKARKALGGADAFERESARKGLDDGATPELRRLIRYESALHRRLRWCVDQIGRGSPRPAPGPGPEPTPIPVAVPDPGPLPPPIPPGPPSPGGHRVELPRRRKPVAIPPASALPEVRLNALERVMCARVPLEVNLLPTPTLPLAMAPAARRE